MTHGRFYLALLIFVSIAVGITARDLGDFDMFYAGGAALLHGANPYTVHGFFSPIYVALLFAPFTLLALPIAFHIHAALVFFCYGIAFYLLTRRVGLTALLMLSPFPLFTAWYGNLEGYVLLGASLAPLVGIWLVLMKPQIGFVVAALFLWREWYIHRSWRRVARLAVPVGAVYAVSLLLGMWAANPLQSAWNISPWPIGLAVGIPVAILALRRGDFDAALFAGPFFSPYLGAASFAGLLPALTARRWLAVLGVIAAWVVVLWWRARV